MRIAALKRKTMKLITRLTLREFLEVEQFTRRSVKDEHSPSFLHEINDSLTSSDDEYKAKETDSKRDERTFKENPFKK